MTPTAFAWNQGVDLVSLHADTPMVSLHKPGHDPQQRCFNALRGAKSCNKIGLFNRLPNASKKSRNAVKLRNSLDVDQSGHEDKSKNKCRNFL